MCRNNDSNSAYNTKTISFCLSINDYNVIIIHLIKQYCKCFWQYIYSGLKIYADNIINILSKKTKKGSFPQN